MGFLPAPAEDHCLYSTCSLTLSPQGKKPTKNQTHLKFSSYKKSFPWLDISRKVFCNKIRENSYTPLKQLRFGPQTFVQKLKPKQIQFCLTAEINIQLTTGMSQWTTFLEINFDQNSFSFATDALNLSLLVLKSMREQLTVSPIFLSPSFAYQFINC